MADEKKNLDEVFGEGAVGTQEPEEECSPGRAEFIDAIRAYEEATRRLFRLLPDGQPVLDRLLTAMSRTVWLAADAIQADQDVQEWESRLRVGIAAMYPGQTLRQKRAACVNAIHRWGAQWKAVAPVPGTKAECNLLVEFIDDLEAAAYPDLGDGESLRVVDEYADGSPRTQPDLEFISTLRAWLNSYDPSPKGKAGAKGAITILSEYVDAYFPEALGLTVDPDINDKADRVESRRKKLARDVKGKSTKKILS